MKAIIGLGNPDIKYKNTRHNTGFMVLDEVLQEKNIQLNDKFNSFFAKKGDELYLLPKTYMNLSGNAVLEMMNFYKLTNKDILVVYDDVSLDFGMLRFKGNGSFGGHNGIKSIINKLGTDVFDRLKVGIGQKPEKMSLENFVLGNFSQSELQDLEKIKKVAKDAINCWLNEGIEKAQNKFNGKIL